MGSTYLLDSNIIIYFLNGKLPRRSHEFLRGVFDNQPQFSVITQIEILGFNIEPKTEKNLRLLVDNSRVVQLSQPIVDKTIEIRKSLKIKTPDAIIAASAIVEDLVLLTRNTDDFKQLPELRLENPFLQGS